MLILLAAVPVVLLLGLVGFLLYCRLTGDAMLKRRNGDFYNHPDKDLPLYNKGHCDRYSVGTFYW